MASNSDIATSLKALADAAESEIVEHDLESLADAIDGLDFEIAEPDDYVVARCADGSQLARPLASYETVVNTPIEDVPYALIAPEDTEGARAIKDSTYMWHYASGKEGVETAAEAYHENK